MSSAAPTFVPRISATAGVFSEAVRPSWVASTSSDMTLPGGDDLLGMTAHTPEAAAPLQRRPPPPSSGLDAAHHIPFGGPRNRSPVPRTFEGLGAVFQQQSEDARGLGRGRLGGGLPHGSRGDAAGSFSYRGRGEGGGSAGPHYFDSDRSNSRGPMGRGGRGSARDAFPRRGSATSIADSEAQRQQTVASRFIAEPLRVELQQRSYAIAAQLDPESLTRLGIPLTVQQYHSLVPLETAAASAEPPAFGVRGQVLKAISGRTGAAVAMRRLSTQQLVPTGDLLATAQQAVDAWSVVATQPNLIVLRHAFVSAEIDQTPALFLLHDLHPGAVSLKQAHMQPTTAANGLMRSRPPTEDVLWSYLVQIMSGIRATHSAHLICHAACLSPSKVLLVSSGRIRIGSLGVGEVLVGTPQSREELIRLQRVDLVAVGRLMVALACVGSGCAVPGMDVVSAHFSSDFVRVVTIMLAAADNSQMTNWRTIVGALGDRIFTALDASQVYGDVLMRELAVEVDNGRFLRLVSRLSAITERPEHAGDTQWSETGDRYLLKLFRDYVFHQVDENGVPALDWGHVIECLNKVDAGVPEKLLLLSRDESSMLVVSYADISCCIASAYADLQSGPASLR